MIQTSSSVDTAAVPRIPLYPPGFLWGSATSAHQVEGGCVNNNWAVFETTTAPSGEPRIAGGQTAGHACDQWNRYPEDIRLMRALDLNAYRFSLEWSRIEPSPGTFDEAALDHYARLASDLRSNGITPCVTLHHFTNPLWFERGGAFLQPDAVALFSRFVGRCTDRLKGVVKHWCTINEPVVYAVNGYVTAEFPPARRSSREAVFVLLQLMRAHDSAFRRIKESDPDAIVGPALSLFHYLPWRRTPLDAMAAWGAHLTFNKRMVRYLAGDLAAFRVPCFPGAVRRNTSTPADFVGINYYTRLRVRVSPWSKEPIGHTTGDLPPDRVTDMGWEIYPEGLLEVLRMVRGWTPLPLIVTENGIADERDTRRGEFIRAHVHALDAGLREGISVAGYFYWSLLDNFEWSHGYDKRFGLYAVDFATQKRSLRPGGAVLQTLIRERTSPVRLRV